MVQLPTYRRQEFLEILYEKNGCIKLEKLLILEEDEENFEVCAIIKQILDQYYKANNIDVNK